MKITVVGPGLIGKVHIALILENPSAELLSIVAPDNLENHEIAKSFGVPIFHALDENITRLRPDAVIIASPNEFHFDQSMSCVRAGIPFLVEKPVTANLTDAQALATCVESSGVPALVGHHRTHSLLLASAKEIISSGRLGELVSFFGSAQFLKPLSYFETGPWRSKAGGGPIMINLIHEIGIMRSLFGEVKKVHAFSSNSKRKFEVEDTATFNLQFESGVLGTFVLSDIAACSRSWEQTSAENPSFPNYDDDCYIITGTKGSLAFPSMRLLSYPIGVEPSWTQKQLETRISVKHEDPLRRQLDHFIDVAVGRTMPLVSVYDGYKNLQVVECIRESIRSCSTIDLRMFNDLSKSSWVN